MLMRNLQKALAPLSRPDRRRLAETLNVDRADVDDLIEAGIKLHGPAQQQVEAFAALEELRQSIARLSPKDRNDIVEATRIPNDRIGQFTEASPFGTGNVLTEAELSKLKGFVLGEYFYTSQGFWVRRPPHERLAPLGDAAPGVGPEQKARQALLQQLAACDFAQLTRAVAAATGAAP